jgi:diguanylate cyclase (GGDEF)-like protein
VEATADRFVRAFLFLRVVAARGLGVACALGYAALLVSFGPRPQVFAAGTLVTLVVALRLFVPRFRQPHLRELEAGLVVLLAAYTALLKLDGSLNGSLSPVLYVVIAWAAALSKRGTVTVLTLAAIGLDAALRVHADVPVLDASYIERAVLLCSFALMGALLLAAQAARIQMRARREVLGEISKLKDEARSFRLLGAGGDKAEPSGEERLQRSSVEEIHQSVHYALELLRRALNLHTAVLLWKNDAGTHYRISELSTDGDDINDAPIAVGDGLLAACDTQRVPVVATGLRRNHHVPYYVDDCPVQSLLALPIAEAGGAVQGVLALDRKADLAFTDGDQELALQAARYCFRAIQNERVFLQLERAKVEQGKLYRAAQTLGAALTEHEVLEAGVRAAREIASFDLAAVTVFDDVARRHEVVAALSNDAKFRELVGATFRHNTGLVSMVVENRFALPYRGEFDAEQQVVLSKRYPWPALPSLLVLPLCLHDRPLGTLILGSRRRQAFGDSVRRTLEVLASHLAVSLSNARMVNKLETMATTDGLTGLLNKRAMLEAAQQKVEAAKRFRRKLSVLVTDIDHFKKVNDTYGHDIGDVVIKGLGELLRKHKRNTDVVARFGGEEFVVLCEETDSAGAMLLAERIREELGRKVFQTPQGPLQVTCSLGVATMPQSGSDWDTLFKAADDALYVSKRGGRNRTSLAGEVRTPASDSARSLVEPSQAPSGVMQVAGGAPHVVVRMKQERR